MSKRKDVGYVINNRYRITGFLGEGGFAMVYKGEDISIGREVAIKILNVTAGGHTPEQRMTSLQRFRQEARTAAKIKHPNAVTIFDVGMIEGDNHPFMVMDMLEGHDLKDELTENGPMEQGRAMALFLRCLEALGEAHRLGIIHKDLKPSNLFLTDPGTDYEAMVILDFGIAGLARGGKRLTQAGQILGTPQYMAPEYIANQVLEPSVDVYQMGLILVEMLTGKPVVNKPDMVSCIVAHTQGTLEIDPAILATPMGEIIREATALDPEQRYKDADHFRRALAAFERRSMALPSISELPPGFGSPAIATGHFGPGLLGTNAMAAVGHDPTQPPTDAPSQTGPQAAATPPAHDWPLPEGDPNAPAPPSGPHAAPSGPHAAPSGPHTAPASTPAAPVAAPPPAKQDGGSGCKKFGIGIAIAVAILGFLGVAVIVILIVIGVMANASGN